MAVKVAINGFGRIGRLVFRAMVEQGLVGKEVEVVAVGDIVPADNLAYLLKYDSTQGRFNGTVGSKKSAADKLEDDILIVNGADIRVVSAKSPAELPWKALGVDIVIESTGLFTDNEDVPGQHCANNVCRSYDAVARNYRYFLCFENDLYPGYVTEKPIEAWASGSVPLWRGIDPDLLAVSLFDRIKTGKVLRYF